MAERDLEMFQRYTKYVRLINLKRINRSYRHLLKHCSSHKKGFLEIMYNVIIRPRKSV